MKCDTIPELEKFLTIQEQALGQNSPEVAATVARLAGLYFSKGMLEESEALYRRALTIREQAFGPHRLEVEDTRKNLEKVLTRKRTPAQIRAEQNLSDSSTSLDAIPASMALGYPVPLTWINKESWSLSLPQSKRLWVRNILRLLIV